MSKPIFFLELVGPSWTQTISFYPEYLLHEYHSDWWTKSKVTIPRNHLSGVIREGVFSGGDGSSKHFSNFLLFLFVSLTMIFGFDNTIVNIAGYFSAIVCLANLIMAIWKRRTVTWLYLEKINSADDFTFCVSDLKNMTKEEFLDKYESYTQ